MVVGVVVTSLVYDYLQLHCSRKLSFHFGKLAIAHPCKRPTAPLKMAEQSNEQTLTENTVSGTVNRRPPTKVRIQITISIAVLV